ncbi:MAG TPA: aerial mycelium formation protein [Acidimicrobiia bacterium]|jgi:hypothetical protein
MSPQQRRIDRVLEADYLTNLGARPIDELRAMQRECSEVETEASYVRRLAHARIDILRAETDRRRAGGSLGDLVEALPKILSSETAVRGDPAGSRIASPLAPSMDIKWNRGLERLIADGTLVNLPNLSDEELETTIEQLGELEREVSQTRASLHAVVDAIDRELGRRVAAGSG